jgi:CubicO group peptidase (beta-lactamase class C family)
MGRRWTFVNPRRSGETGWRIVETYFDQKRNRSVALYTAAIARWQNTQYGFGWRLGTGRQGRKIIHHGGTIDGGRTFLILYPENDLIVAIAANMSGVSINLPEVETIAGYFFNAK